MKTHIFFVSLALLAGCKNIPEDEVDLDQMVLLEDDVDQKALAGEPVISPQEALIKESPDAQY